MKCQLLLLGLIGTTLGVNLFGDQPSQAEPAPIFQPILTEIRDRLPADFQMRLPAALPKFTEELDLHAFIPEANLQVVNLGDKDVFSVLVADVPNCEQTNDPESCIVGVISVTEALSSTGLTPEDLPQDLTDLTPVTLAEAATGFYFTQETDIQLVVWEQNNLGYLLMAEQCEDECVSKAELIAIARSAAQEPAITKSHNH